MPEPLALYIHWPFCKSKCPYCDFNSHVRERIEQDRWKTALLQELAWTAAVLPNRRLYSIFFGGGTPSLMAPETAAALIEAARAYWPSDPDLEITLEANPTSVEAGRFREFRQAGINRVSLGIQSLREDRLAFLGREHSAKEALDAVSLAASIFPRYSFDLIYALPQQSRESWRDELQEALKHAGSHLSLYQLTIEENTAFHHAYHRAKAFSLPVEDESALLYNDTQEMMEKVGMPAYEVSNHAIPGQESRHNLAYWHGLEYAGIGPGAHGRIHLPEPASGTIMRHATLAQKSPERWLEQVEREGNGFEPIQALSPQERTEEWLMMRLRISDPIALSSMPDNIRTDRLPLLADQGLIALDAETLRVTPKGRLVLTALAAELLA